MSCIQVWPLIKAMDHIRAHMQTQQKRTHLNTAFLFHRVLLCDESLHFLLYSLRATSHARLCHYLSSTLLPLLWQLMRYPFVPVLLCMCKLVRLLKKKSINSLGLHFFHYSSNNWNFRYAHTHNIKYICSREKIPGSLCKFYDYSSMKRKSSGRIHSFLILIATWLQVLQTLPVWQKKPKYGKKK